MGKDISNLIVVKECKAWNADYTILHNPELGEIPRGKIELLRQNVMVTPVESDLRYDKKIYKTSSIKDIPEGANGILLETHIKNNRYKAQYCKIDIDAVKKDKELCPGMEIRTVIERTTLFD